MRIHPRQTWVWLVGGGAIGSLMGLINSQSDMGTGLLVGMLLGWSAKYLATPWMPRRPR
jgi:hypothetical protein